MSEGPGTSETNQTFHGVPHIGDTIAGKYEVTRVLGVGGMGVVVAAQHKTLGHPVAIKFLLPEALKQEGAVERFLREARSAVRIQSEHVVRIHDVDTLETGAPYVVMELLDGQDLGQLVNERGALPISEAVDYVIQALDAIAEAHSLGIVHRDLKPANLFLSRRADGSPLVKVLDFGISKAKHAGDKHLTATTAIMGSPQYMSPEQVRSSRDVDARADVWALGVILQQLLTGNLPFDGETVLGVCAKILTEQPVLLSHDRPDVPPELEQIVSACLEKDLGRRLQNVGALARALAPYSPPGSEDLIVRIGRVAGTPVSIAFPGTGPIRSAPPSAAAPSGPHFAPTTVAPAAGMPASQYASYAAPGTVPPAAQIPVVGMVPPAAQIPVVGTVPPAAQIPVLGSTEPDLAAPATRRHTGLVVGLVIGVLVLAGGAAAAYVALRGDRPAAPGAAPPVAQAPAEPGPAVTPPAVTPPPAPVAPTGSPAGVAPTVAAPATPEKPAAAPAHATKGKPAPPAAKTVAAPPPPAKAVVAPAPPPPPAPVKVVAPTPAPPPPPPPPPKPKPKAIGEGTMEF